jgi:methylene-tetrahydromethanopterin dehydrogenase
MADKHILHMLSPLRHVSPFDVNMALDAGFDAVLPYGKVNHEEVTSLVQDAIFSRPPKLAAKTGIFIGGKDALVALDMMESAKSAMVPPFVISLFADPAGSFTTAAAMVARSERLLDKQHGRGLDGLRLAVFGATGVVGFAAAVIAALEGARVTLVGHDGGARVSRSAAEIANRFSVTAAPTSARRRSCSRPKPCSAPDEPGCRFSRPRSFILRRESCWLRTPTRCLRPGWRASMPWPMA